jgi:hypothetical protein
MGIRITHVRILLMTEFALQDGFLVVWWLAEASPSPGQVIGLIVLSSLAMGVQTAIVRLLNSTSGITTTFVTGTLASLIEGEARGARGGNTSRVAVVLALVVGALLGAIALKVVPSAAPALAPLAVLGAGFLLGRRHTLARYAGTFRSGHHHRYHIAATPGDPEAPLSRRRPASDCGTSS